LTFEENPANFIPILFEMTEP